MSARSGRELQLAGHHPALGLVAASAGPGDHGCGLSCQRPPEPASSAAPGVGPCDTGHVIRTAQVTGLISRHHQHRPARYLKGPPQGHCRSVRGQRKPQRLTGSRFIHGRSLHSAGQAGHAGAACCPRVAAHMKRHGVSRHGSAPVHGDTPVPAGFSPPPAIPRTMRARPPGRQ
jgi:hypothetical protein